MNVMLLRDGYPPVSIGPEHKSGYVAALERRHVAEPVGHGIVDDGARGNYQRFMAQRLVASLRDHLTFLGREGPGFGNGGGAGAPPEKAPVPQESGRDRSQRATGSSTKKPTSKRTTGWGR